MIQRCIAYRRRMVCLGIHSGPRPAGRDRWFAELFAGGRWILTSGSWSDLLRRDALPRDLPVFLAFAGLARRGNEDHALALEAHPAHLIAADPGRIRRRVNPRDKPLAIMV